MTTLNKILDLPTPRLLAYYKKHYRRSNPFVDREDDGVYNYDKEKHHEWQAIHDAIRAELDNREHVEK